MSFNRKKENNQQLQEKTGNGRVRRATQICVNKDNSSGAKKKKKRT